jgi:hypothetical protein
MTYKRAFHEFKTEGVWSTSDNFDGNNAKCIPHHELVFQTPKASLGLEEEY